MLHCT
ncbi:Protein of unknown function [Escherichia coli D6-117.29]